MAQHTFKEESPAKKPTHNPSPSLSEKEMGDKKIGFDGNLPREERDVTPGAQESGKNPTKSWEKTDDEADDYNIKKAI